MNQALLNLESGEDLCNLLREVFSKGVCGASGLRKRLGLFCEHGVM